MHLKSQCKWGVVTIMWILCVGTINNYYYPKVAVLEHFDNNMWNTFVATTEVF